MLALYTKLLEGTVSRAYWQKGSSHGYGISIITVTYNSTQELPEFYASLSCQDIPLEVHLIDNASTDATPQVLRKLAATDQRLHVTLNNTNVGLGAANNQPIGRLLYDYVAIVNPDVVLYPNALAVLITYLQSHSEAVAVGPINVDPTGMPHSSFHRNWTLAHLLVWRIFPLWLTHWLYDHVRHYGEQDVLFVSGSCLVVRRVDYETIGGYDPEYFLTVEDVCDLCIRLRLIRPGNVVRVTPDAKITHLRSRSTISVPFFGLWHGARGSIYHFQKHYGLAAALAATAVILMACLLRMTVSLPLAILSSRYRKSARNQAALLYQLLNNNPIWDRSVKPHGRNR